MYSNLTAEVRALTWFGSVNGTWDMSTLNWNTNTTVYQEYSGVGDMVTFDDTLYNNDTNPPNTNITIATVVSPYSMTVNNSAYNYSFSGSPISGQGVLTKSGTGVLTLSGANSYSGGTLDAGGMLQVGNNNALGVGPVTFSGGALSSDGGNSRALGNDLVVNANVRLGDGTNNGALTLNGDVDLGNGTRNLNLASPVTLSGSVSDGAITKLGTDTLTLEGTAVFNNACEVQNGAFVVDGGAVTVLNNGFRPDAGAAGVTTRLIVTNGGQLTIASTGINALWIG